MPFSCDEECDRLVFADDPNVANKKFVGNITQSYRTRHPILVVGERIIAADFACDDDRMNADMRTDADPVDDLPAEFTALQDVILSRRTSLLMDREREVPLALVAELCELAQWAPNHKRTWPWRFALATGGQRQTLGSAFAGAQRLSGVTDAAKLAKTEGKYLRAPTILAVGRGPHDDAFRRIEDRDCVAAGIQNLLLGATALGLASYWSSSPTPDDPDVLDLLGFEPGSELVAVVYLGYPNGMVDTPARPAVTIQLLGSNADDPGR